MNSVIKSNHFTNGYDKMQTEYQSKKKGTIITIQIFCRQIYINFYKSFNLVPRLLFSRKQKERRGRILSLFFLFPRKRKNLLGNLSDAACTASSLLMMQISAVQSASLLSLSEPFSPCLFSFLLVALSLARFFVWF